MLFAVAVSAVFMSATAGIAVRMIVRVLVTAAMRVMFVLTAACVMPVPVIMRVFILVLAAFMLMAMMLAVMRMFAAICAVCMCILQIGKLVGRLSEEYRLEHADIPWHKIRGMRNFVAHEYGHLDLDVVWYTATKSIPELRRFCEQNKSEKSYN